MLSGSKSVATAQGTGSAQAVAGLMTQGFCMVGVYSDDGEDILVNIGFVPSDFGMSKTTQLMKRGNNIDRLESNSGGTLAAYPTTDANKEYTFFVIKLI